MTADLIDILAFDTINSFFLWSDFLTIPTVLDAKSWYTRSDILGTDI